VTRGGSINTSPDADAIETTDTPPDEAASGVLDAGSSQSAPSIAAGSRLAERYRIERAVGHGAMGTVYEAIDEQRAGLRVALKLLARRQPHALYQLKNEFRALGEIVHPNLVGLHGLGVDPLGWYVVMDLVDPSCDFLSYVRNAATGAYDESRVRAALAQLVRGIAALHGAGKLHRDLKPSNVLVTGEGRVVIVDFGLVSELGKVGVSTMEERVFVGTPAYAPPEQLLGAPLGPTSDLYAVGVILYEALTGTRPVEDAAKPRLLARKRELPPAPSAIAPQIPADLDGLCIALLHPDSRQRPDTSQVLQQLGDQARSVPEATSSLPFVARERELTLLVEAAGGSRAGPRVVVLSGPSGIGKTALVTRFLECAAREASALSARGRCHPNEQLPFKAFDPLIDQLVHHLTRIPAMEAASLMPRDVGLVSRLFPTLSRIPSVHLLSLGREPDMDRALQRSRAFAAFKELLARIAERWPLVLAFDDLQWGDPDSAELFCELLREPGAPACLFVCVFRERRPGEDGFAEMLRVLPRTIALELAPLDPPASTALARSLLGNGWAPADLDRIVAEAAGSPFLLKELSRQARASGRVSELQDAVRARVVQLDAQALRLLELVCLAGRPLELGTALRTAQVEPQSLPAVLASALLRPSIRDGRECVESQHDRIREAVVASIAPELRAHLHGALARAFAQGPGAEPDLSARHYLAAGEPQLAAQHAVVAARRAARALAFGRAAELYELAIAHVGDADKPALESELADTHAALGRLSDAAGVYERAIARCAPGDLQRELSAKAMALHLLLGNLQRGTLLLHALCKQLGLFAPSRRPWLTRFAVLPLYLRYRLGRSVASLAVPVASRHTASSKERLELCMRAARGLSHWSFEQASYFSLRAVLLIRQHRDPTHWPYALAVEVARNGVFKGIASPQDDERYDQALALAESQGNDDMFALILAGDGSRCILTGQFARATQSFERAERLMTTRGRSVAPVFNGVRTGLLSLWIMTGRVHHLIEHAEAWQAEAQALGDRWGERIAQLLGSYRFLAFDQPERMRESVQSLIRAAGPDAPPFAAHPGWLAEPALYLGELDRAAAACSNVGRTFFSHLRAFAFDRATCAHLWIRVCLATARARPRQRAHHLRQVEREVHRLRRERFVTAPAIASQARAGLALLRGDEAAARRELQKAAAGFDSAGFELYAAAMRERLGRMTKGEEGAQLVADARAAATERGIRNPERLFLSLCSGFPD
jgi:tetratricopeptide (TPR) repeat protein